MNKAEQLRQIADDANTGSIEEILKAAEDYAGKGDYQFHYYRLLKRDQIASLEAEGLKVTNVGERETCYCIAWEKQKPGS